MVKVWSLLVHDNGWSMGRHDGSSYEKRSTMWLQLQLNYKKLYQCYGGRSIGAGVLPSRSGMTTKLWTVGEARPLGAIPRDGAWHEAGRSDTRDQEIHAYSSSTTTSFWRQQHAKEGASILEQI